MEDVETWRAARLSHLTSPGGWLSLVGLEWLREGENHLGSDPAADVRFPGGRAPADIGTITVREGDVEFVAAPGAGVMVDGHPVDRIGLRPTGRRPTVLRLGPIRFLVIERDGRYAVRIKDPESPVRTRFTGIEHWPVDLRWRFDARFEPRTDVMTAKVPAVVGPGEIYRLPGWLAFEHEGETHSLEAFEETPGEDFLVVFADATSGIETYPGGRFVYVKPPDGDGMTALDFNKAYNPPCVFTPFATCPLPPPGNRLPFRVEAGEKEYRGT